MKLREASGPPTRNHETPGRKAGGLALSSPRISRPQCCGRLNPQFLAQTRRRSRRPGAGRFATAGVAARLAAAGLPAATLLLALDFAAAGFAAASLFATAGRGSGAGHFATASRGLVGAAHRFAALRTAAAGLPAAALLLALGLAAADFFATAGRRAAGGLGAADVVAAAAAAISTAHAEELERAGLASHTQQTDRQDRSKNTIHERGSSKNQNTGRRKRKQRNTCRRNRRPRVALGNVRQAVTGPRATAQHVNGAAPGSPIVRRISLA